MVNYQNGKIYKIVNDELNLTYYGSTIQPLNTRLRKHKNDVKIKNLSSKILFTTKTEAQIFLVENVPCNNKDELRKRERFYIENFQCVNKTIPCQTRKESLQRYKNKNLELCKKRCKDWRDRNKEKISKKFNCECGGKYTHEHKSGHFKTKKHQNFINSF